MLTSSTPAYLFGCIQISKNLYLSILIMRWSIDKNWFFHNALCELCKLLLFSRGNWSLDDNMSWEWQGYLTFVCFSCMPLHCTWWVSKDPIEFTKSWWGNVMLMLGCTAEACADQRKRAEGVLLSLNHNTTHTTYIRCGGPLGFSQVSHSQVVPSNDKYLQCTMCFQA